MKRTNILIIVKTLQIFFCFQVQNQRKLSRDLKEIKTTINRNTKYIEWPFFYKLKLKKFTKLKRTREQSVKNTLN